MFFDFRGGEINLCFDLSLGECGFLRFILLNIRIFYPDLLSGSYAHMLLSLDAATSFAFVKQDRWVSQHQLMHMRFGLSSVRPYILDIFVSFGFVFFLQWYTGDFLFWFLIRRPLVLRFKKTMFLLTGRISFSRLAKNLICCSRATSILTIHSRGVGASHHF